ncbi:terminase [Melittangium boletus]|uniref:Phage terminase small subunit n=1 Tax=Melittangium boletus DSM 14713 TaxID=1294270 RepID=A0A250I6D1_9BACT|nr:terminase [Melittangium boletus]ATB26721.1 phage terminase small subunit [Melittangium boletus DSM 14713]
MRYIPRMMTNRTEGLLPWQWKLYAGNHAERRNLLLHGVSVPVFQLGTVLLVASPFTGLAWALPGIAAMVGAVAVQGRGHRRETTPPVPFQGPLDVFARIFLEQWVTFPRFVLSGGFARAWRATSSGTR